MFGRLNLLFGLSVLLLTLSGCGPLTALGLTALDDDDDDDNGGTTAPLIAPSSPQPLDGAQNVPVVLSLGWSADPSAVAFEVFFGEEDNIPMEPTATTEERQFSLPRLDFDTRYAWRVDALGADGRRAVGPLWTFSTIEQASPTFELSADPIVTLLPGDTFELDLSIIDPDDFVTLIAEDVPESATWADTTEPTRAPLEAKFSYTPTEDDIGLSIVTFRAGDLGGSSQVTRLFLQVIDPWAATIDLNALDGSDGIIFLPFKDDERVGFSVSGIGDVNEDGFDDAIVGLPFATFAQDVPGSAVLFLGGPEGSTDGREILPRLGDRGVSIFGKDDGDEFGKAVHGLGDINGDGVSDFAVGATGANRGAGVLYVIFGGDHLVPGERFILGDLEGGQAGIAIFGIAPDDSTGASVSGLGDIDGDGFDDMILGTPNADPESLNRAGQATVLFGRSDFGREGRLDLADLGEEDGFRLDGIEAQSQFGVSVCAAGDVDGDGFKDFLIGAPFSNPDEVQFAGEAFLVLSSEEIGKDGFLNLLDPRDATVIRLFGDLPDRLVGLSCASLGDTNEDGFDDFGIGAPGLGDGVSSFTVLYGGEYWRDRSRVGLNELPEGESWTVTRNRPGARIGFGSAGANDVNGDGVPDVMVGNPGLDSDEDEAFCLYGTIRPPGVALGDLDGQLGVQFNDGFETNNVGWSVSGIGDTNGDGFGDVLIGSTLADLDDGRAYLVFGRPGAFIATASARHPEGRTASRSVGANHDGSSADHPSTQIAIAFDAGDDLSQTTVTYWRSRDGLFQLPDDLTRAQVVDAQWEIETDRAGWSEATVVFTPPLSAIEGLDFSNPRVFRADSFDGPWEPVGILETNLIERTITIKTETLGFFMITE